MTSQHLEEQYERGAQLLKIVGHPKRIQILDLLSNRGEMNVSQVQKELGLAQSPVSQHLAKLRLHNVVETRREGTTVYYSIGQLGKRLTNSIIESIKERHLA